MRLIDVKNGKKVIIESIAGGKGVDAKLRQLSLMPGDTIEVVQRAPLHGPILVEESGRRVALGRGVAAMVEVSPCE